MVEESLSKAQALLVLHWTEASPDTLWGEVGNLSKRRDVARSPFGSVVPGKTGVSAWEKRGAELLQF